MALPRDAAHHSCGDPPPDPTRPDLAPRRRQFLRLAIGAPVAVAGWLQGCAPENPMGEPRASGGGASPLSPDGTRVLPPRVNGGINIHVLRCWDCEARDATIDPSLLALQLSALYELGFDGVRLTAPLGDRHTLLAAIPYVRAARALGIDAVVVLADFSGLTLARALHDDARRERILRMYASIFAPAPEPVVHGLGGLGPKGVGRIAFQILNEPVGFVGLPPEVYVGEILTPAYGDIKRLDPNVIVVSAAETGIAEGPPRMRAMLEAGLERTTDRIAYHVYSRDVIRLLPADVRQIVWVTESGVRGTAGHLAWVRDVFPEIKARLGDVLRTFYYDLFDFDRDGYRVLAIERAGAGFRAVVESGALHAYWAERVLTAAGGPLVPFGELVPDLRPYLATPADTAALDEALQP